VKIVTRIELALLAAALLGVTAAAVASETITYTYDARGRLIKVVRSGTANNSVSATYTYDRADNRTNVNVVSPNQP
jgi:YD repeat-containing protein